MDQDYAQRRRVAFAIAVTVIAVPAAFLLNRGDASGSADVTLAPGLTLPGAAVITVERPAVTSPLGTAPAGFLEGSTVPESNEPARIAIPLLAESIKSTATFSSDIPSAQRCAVPGVPFNSTVTVTNLDNSRRVQCLANVAVIDPEGDVILATDTFLQIADPTDAPVPVEITWTAPAVAPAPAPAAAVPPATVAP
jgi:hypothetical protein